MTDWAALQHAYGEASDVPRLLAMLASEDVEARNGAFYEFFGSLCHQGSVYSASLAAIPALLELLGEPGYPDRQRLLEALAALATGWGEGVDMADVHAALSDGRTALLAVLASGSEAEKLHALEIFTGRAFADAGEALLVVATEDSSPRVRARAWERLAAIAPERIPAVIDDEPAVVLAASLARLATVERGSPLVDEATRRLRDPAARAVLTRWSHGSSPFRPCAAHLDDASMLATLSAALVDAYHPEDATRLAGVLLAAAFTKEPVDLAAVNAKQREVLAALVQSESVWQADGAMNGNLLTSLAEHRLPSGFDAREAIAEALGVARTRRVVVVRPRQVRGAREAAIELGRDAWLDVPFVFLRGVEGLSEAIPEDPADFPPEVMDDFGAIARPILAQVIAHTCPVETSAFYPQLTAEQFEAIARELEFEVVPPVLVFAEDSFDPSEHFGAVEPELEADLQAAPPPCLLFTELSDEAKERLAAFVDCFDRAGFSEVRQSYATARTMGEAGIHVTPLAIARRFGAATQIQVGFHCDASNGMFLRALLSDADGGGLALRFLAVSDAFFAAVAAVALDEAPATALLPLGTLGETILLEHGGSLMELTLTR